MRHALVAVVRGQITDGMELKRLGIMLELSGIRHHGPAHLAAKNSVYAAWKRAGIMQMCSPLEPR